MELRKDGAFYEISPWALSWDNENYYMIGFDSEANKIKHFRVDKMLKSTCMEENREGKEFFDKFDMAVYVFESQIADWHKVYPELGLGSVENEDDLIIGTNRGFITSYKLLEFHNCEINYNSIKSGWSELNNQTGITPTYTIDISYDDCYEISYNEHMMRKIGDVIATDISQAIISDGIINNSNL